MQPHHNNDKNFFYKYLSFEGAFQTLIKREIRLISPRKFNDPHDAKFKIRPPFRSADDYIDFAVKVVLSNIERGLFPDFVKRSGRINIASGTPVRISEKDKEDLRARLRPIYEKTYEEYVVKINLLMKATFPNLFFYCLSEDYQETLMWAHYADSHRGAVIKFKCLPEIDNLFLAAQKVEYLREQPTYGTREEWVELILESKEPNLKQLFNNMYATKEERWSYEREWRIVAPRPGGEGKDYDYDGFTAEEVDAVYFGSQMVLDEKQRLLNLVKNCYPQAKMYEGKVADSYSIEFHELIEK